MSKLLSNFSGKRHVDFVGMSVYDAILDEDKNLHVDPLLIKGSNIPEFKNGYDQFLNHFGKVMRITAQIHSDIDIFAKTLRKYLTFKELPNTGLGYGKSNPQGKVRGTGISGILANSLYETTKQLYKAGVTDPEIFALVPLFQEGFGADRISDMTISILKSNFLSYTVRICYELPEISENLWHLYALGYYTGQEETMSNLATFLSDNIGKLIEVQPAIEGEDFNPLDEVLDMSDMPEDNNGEQDDSSINKTKGRSKKVNCSISIRTSKIESKFYWCYKPMNYEIAPEILGRL